MNDVFSKIEGMPLIAILRGITPDEAIAVSDQLVEAGFVFLEVTLNSPDWEESMKLISQKHGKNIVLGAGTVLHPDEVKRAKAVGAEMIISPNFDADVVREAKAQGLVSAPGCYTPSECFRALKAGADILKIFPADTLGLSFIKAISAVLPKGTKICPTGGVTLDNMSDFVKADVYAMGMGSALYKAGKAADQVGADARRFIEAFRQSSVN